MPFEEAMRRYGSDKPDLRIPLELVDADQLKEVEFLSPVRPTIRRGVSPPCVPRRMPRSQIDDSPAGRHLWCRPGLHRQRARKGVEGLQSPIVKFIPEANRTCLESRWRVRRHRVLGADKQDRLRCPALRIKVAMLSGRPCGSDFPMFENDDGSRPRCTTRSPRPSAPRPSLRPIRARRFPAPTTWCSTAPSCGGSIRIHDKSMQQAVPRATRRSRKRSSARSRALNTVRRRRLLLRPGSPGHADDRCIREVIAFPEDQSAGDVMTQAPGSVDGKACCTFACASSRRRITRGGAACGASCREQYGVSYGWSF